MRIVPFLLNLVPRLFPNQFSPFKSDFKITTTAERSGGIIPFGIVFSEPRTLVDETAF